MATNENTWPTWIETIAGSINHFACTTVELVSMAFGIDSNSTTAVKSTESLVEKYTFFMHNAVASLAFDHFQFLLLKIFLLILIICGILIITAWHIYGVRISERFMHSSRDSRATSPGTVK